MATDKEKIAVLETKYDMLYSLLEQLLSKVDESWKNVEKLLKEFEHKIMDQSAKEQTSIDKRLSDIEDEIKKLDAIRFLVENPKLALLIGAWLYLFAVMDSKVLIWMIGN